MIEQGSAPKAKRLPRNPENGYFRGDFEANGKKYFISNPADGFPLSRDTVFGKFMAMYWYGGAFNTPMMWIGKLYGIANGIVRGKNELTDLILTLKEMDESVRSLSESKFDFSLYLCSTFIFSEDEKLIDPWEQSRAEMKIEDWGEYAREDFFELTAVFIVAYSNTSGQLLEAVGQTLDTATAPKNPLRATVTTKSDKG